MAARCMVDGVPQGVRIDLPGIKIFGELMLVDARMNHVSLTFQEKGA
jgi:hypothetical protein